MRPKIPTLGSNLAGEVEAVGRGVERFREGDEVFAATGASLGAHAEYVCLPEGGALAPKPANMIHGEAVSLCSGGLTALPFLRDTGKIRHGQKVLINGASGSVGTAAVQLARCFGADVTGVCSTANLGLVTSLGADAVIDYTEEDFTRRGERYDLIFDAVGKRSFARCKEVLRPGGIYLSTVLTAAILPQMLWTSAFGGKRAAIAFTGLRPAGEKTSDLLFLKELAEAGRIEPVVDRSCRLEQIAEAHRYVDKGHKKGNVVITLAP